ncbi:hypothetical protein [Aureispira sp. CCB-E]|uniref:hypothetical protein n=1 Tax=Aureispira sp. CCB-E TaxID=3051121 RepID=UPI0028694F0A|nr:hypothetical protein [Aureispira sp. CCB-E]WMX17083.1 hypothetical protein QP953_11935 [Aureispira sp. CCB-E]
MKNVGLLILFNLFISSIFSQNSDSYIFGKSSSVSCFGEKKINEKNIISYSQKTIAIYDKKTLNLISSKDIENFPEDDKCWNFFEFQEEFFYLFYSQKKDAKTFKIYIRKLNLDATRLEAPQNLYEEPVTGRIGYFINGSSYIGQKPFLGIQLSKDSSKLAVILGQKVQVFEKGMKLLWKTDNVYGYHSPSGPFDMHANFLDNNGDYYSIIKVFKYNKERKNEYDWADYRETVKKSYKPNYEVLILKANSNSIELLNSEALKGQLVHSMTIHKDNKGNLYCMGACFADRNITRTSAFFIMDMTQEVPKLNKFKIPGEIEHFNKKKIPEINKGVSFLKNLEVINCNDGNLLMICEQNLNFDPAGVHSSGTGNYGNILAFKISLTGDIIWSRILLKWQLNTKEGGYYRFNSYKYFYLNDKHYIVFLDNKGNEKLNYERVKYCTNGKNSVIMAYCLDDDGKVDKKILFDIGKLTQRTTYDYRRSLIPLSPNELMLSTYQKKQKTSLVKIIIDK